jgi:hypothetical protein
MREPFATGCHVVAPPYIQQVPGCRHHPLVLPIAEVRLVSLVAVLRATHRGLIVPIRARTYLDLELGFSFVAGPQSVRSWSSAWH